MVHPYEKARDWLIERVGPPKFKRLDIRGKKSMQLTWLLGIQMHATFVLKCGKCSLRMKQCNVMESCTMFMTFFPYFVILIWFLKKHRLNVLLKEVIIHATLSYLSQISPGMSSEYMFCLIYSLDNFGVTTMEPFNQSPKIPGFVTPFFLFKNIDGWELLTCP